MYVYMIINLPRFSVVECPSSALALSNCLIVHPSDFPTAMHVMVNSQFPLTTRRVHLSDVEYVCCMFIYLSSMVRHDNTGKIAPGQIGASSSQRQWIGLSIAGDEVTLSPLDLPPAEIYLDSLDLEVGFWKRGLEIAEQFSADEMTKNFIRAFSGQIFALDQQLVFDFHGQNLKASVKGLGVLELADGQQKRKGSAHGVSHMGVLMDRTDVVFIKAPDSRIKIKSSEKKCVSTPAFVCDPY